MISFSLIKNLNETVDVLKIQSLLLELQTECHQLDFLKKEIDELKIATKEDEDILQKRKNYHKNFLPSYEKAKEQYANLQIDVKQMRDNIEKSEEKKKVIQTIKEFKAINKEIENWNRKIAIFENDILAKKEEIEFKETKIQNIEEKIESIEDELKIKQDNLSVLLEERNEDIKNCTSRKINIEKKINQISEALLPLFYKIYHYNDKNVITPIEENTCLGCNIYLPLQIQVNVKRAKDLSFCPSCSQILYLKEAVN